MAENRAWTIVVPVRLHQLFTDADGVDTGCVSISFSRDVNVQSFRGSGAFKRRLNANRGNRGRGGQACEYPGGRQVGAVDYVASVLTRC